MPQQQRQKYIDPRSVDLAVFQQHRGRDYLIRQLVLPAERKLVPAELEDQFANDPTSLCVLVIRIYDDETHRIVYGSRVEDLDFEIAEKKVEEILSVYRQPEKPKRQADQPERQVLGFAPHAFAKGSSTLH